MTIPEYIKDFISYNQHTGVFRWDKVRTPRMVPGTEIHTKHSDGSVVVKFNDKQIRAHRLAWWWVYGELPKGWIDHINGDRADNRISNLRLASPEQNGRNSRKLCKSSTEFKGVSANGNRFRARCSLNGAQVHIGSFPTAEEANEAVRKFREENHKEFHNHG